MIKNVTFEKEETYLNKLNKSFIQKELPMNYLLD